MAVINRMQGVPRLLALILPLILFFLAQRFFVQGIVITGVEK